MDSELGALILEHDCKRLDDLLPGIGLAVDDDLVLDDLALLQVEEMLLGEAVIPAAIPSGEEIGVFLEGPGQLCAGQGLNIDEAVGIDIARERNLGRRRRRVCADELHRHGGKNFGQGYLLY